MLESASLKFHELQLLLTVLKFPYSLSQKKLSDQKPCRVRAVAGIYKKAKITYGLNR